MLKTRIWKAIVLSLDYVLLYNDGICLNLMPEMFIFLTILKTHKKAKKCTVFLFIPIYSFLAVRTVAVSLKAFFGMI